jgi:hypothetical protein
VVARAERPARLDGDDETPRLGGRLPRRGDEQPPADGDRTEVRAPRLRPVLLGDRGHARAAGGGESQRDEGIEVGVDASGERGHVVAVDEERAQAPRAVRAGFLHDAERAQLPHEVRETFGGIR